MRSALDHEANITITPTLPLPRPGGINSRALTLWVGLALVVWALAQAGLFTGDVVNAGGWPLAWRFVQGAFAPELSLDFLWVVVDATLVTLGYAVLGTALSLVLGVVGGVLSSEAWWQAVYPPRRETARPATYHAPWLVVRAALALPRAIHEIIWGLFFVNILGLDPLTAILAIAIPFGAITAKVFSELLDETPRQPLDALLNSGAPPLSAFLYGLLPPVLPNWLSYAFYRFECSVRSAATLGIIGAGGLGFQLLLSFQSLRYEQMWTLLYALILLCGLIDMWSSALRRRVGGANRIELNAREDLTPRPPLLGGEEGRERNFVWRGSLALGVALIVFSWWYIGPSVEKLVAPRTLTLLGDVLRESWPPRLSVPLAELWRVTLQTLGISILAAALAGVGGILLAFPAARTFLLPGGLLDPLGQGRQRGRPAQVILWLTRTALLVMRAIPPPVWALICLFVLFPGTLPGALALGLYTLGILGRLMAEVVEDLDERPLRALAGLGAPGPSIFLYGALPLTLPRCVAYILYRWEVCTRETVVIGVVGAAGLGRLLAEQLSSFNYQAVLSTLLVYLALTFIVDVLSAWARRALR